MDKVDTAIKRLQTASEMSLATYGKPMMICISGGKDSGVLLDLVLAPAFPSRCSTVTQQRTRPRRCDLSGSRCTSWNAPAFRRVSITLFTKAAAQVCGS